MTRRLPPFGPLIAFDAVVRHRSFTRAADELGVTQSAVSHRVRRLEDFLGVQLLKRLNPGVELSDDGARLQGELATLLDGMASLEPSLRRRAGQQTLRLGAGSSLAAWWLVRRLRTFRALHSEIEIDFVPVESEAAGEPPLDVRILWTTLAESRATSLQASLFRERVFPVCAPSILPRGQPLSDPAALLELPLIQKRHTPSGEWSWASWFQKLGLKRAEPRGLVLGDMGLCLTAAVEGAGVAIGRSLLVADAIGDGRLVPSACNRSRCALDQGPHCPLEPGPHWRPQHPSSGQLARAGRRGDKPWCAKRLAAVMSPAARATLRVALRHCWQWNAFRRALTAWRSVYDRLDSASVEDPMETLH